MLNRIKVSFSDFCTTKNVIVVETNKQMKITKSQHYLRY